MQQRQARTGQAQGAAAHLYQQAVAQGLVGQAFAVQADDQHRRGRQYRHCNAGEQGARQSQGRRGSGQVAQGGQGSQRGQRTAEGEAGEHRHPRNFWRAQAVTGIQPVAHRAARKHRQANGIANRECAEATQHQGSRGQLHACIAAGRPFVAQQNDETYDRGQQRAKQGRGRYAEHGIVQRVDVEFAQQMATGNQRQREQHQGHGQADGLAITAYSFKPGQALRNIGQRRREWRLGIGIVSGHEMPRASCARWGRGAAK
ncbi:hypothetical protein D3C81_826380 [compost metagenome]